jgi:hypothetical protein
MLNPRLAIVVAVAGLLVASATAAHNPADTDFRFPNATARLVPATCDQLADTLNYSDDVSNPDIKALKADCDAKAKAAGAKVPAVNGAAVPAKDEVAKPE